MWDCYYLLQHMPGSFSGAPAGSASGHEQEEEFIVRLHTTKTTAVCASALALVLPLAACGSSDEAASGGLSTAAEAPGSESSAVDGAASETTEAASETNSADGSTATETTRVTKDAKNNDKTTANKGNQAAGNQGEAPTIANPFENGMPKNTNQPLASGKEGSEEDRKQMEATARAVLNPPSFAEWTTTILDNSCKAVVDPMMEELDRQGLTLEQVEEAGRLAESQGQAVELPRTDVKIEDVRVDGNRASASLTATSDSGEQTETMIFEKEDGRWKLCN